jgi:hypothetical protein
VQDRYHVVKIVVADGLSYYVEVRQRPGSSGQVFDGAIPGTSAPREGGVVVTKVVSDSVNNNQQARFITLLHNSTVLTANDIAIDPARDLTITVLDDDVVDRPLVCKVRIAWAQGIADDPDGAFDLSIEPWDSSWQSPDIWVDRNPLGTFDQPKDAAGRPQGNGDKPKPGEINKFFARVHCSGAISASNVKVTFYAVEPPGVGDNGSWSPLVTRTVASVAAGGFADVTADWVPLLGEHTCLRAFVSQQLGEISGGNNWTQEIVFDFEAPAFSPPRPVFVPVAVRNPRDDATIAHITVKQVPRGYRVQFPHRWVRLEAHEERRFELLVIPIYDVSAYVEQSREAPATAPVIVEGYLERQYHEPLPTGELPASTFSYIGGILANVTPKRATTIELSEDRELSTETTAVVRGTVAHAHRRDRVRVSLTALSDPARPSLVVETRTDEDGAFVARLPLTRLAGRRRPLRGSFAAQASTFAAATVAEASSNILSIAR